MPSDDWAALIPAFDDLRDAHMIYLLLGAFICAFGLLSHFLKERLYMSEAMVATVVGILIGPVVANQLAPAEKFGLSLDKVTFEFTRVVICIQCMACGVDLPGNYCWRERLSLFMLVVPALIMMWLITGLGIWLIIGNLGFLEALIIACCLTPTDPVLANSIVKGKFAEKYIPLNVRLILSAESGANDGLGTPLLFIAIYLLRMDSPGLAVWEWFYKVFLYQIILAIVIGAVVAHLGQLALKLAERNGFIDKESLLSFSIALALFIMGLVSLLNADDILAAFVAGNVLTWDQWFNDKMRSSQFQEIIDHLINLTYFVYFGAIIPWSTMFSVVAVWKMVLLALFVLFLRRVPVVFALSPWIPALEDRRQTFFAAWFGPMGASAVFYALLSTSRLDVPVHPLQEIVFFMVLTSVVVHGGSVPLFNMGLQRIESWRSGERPGWSWVWERYTARVSSRRRLVVRRGDGNGNGGLPRFDTGKRSISRSLGAGLRDESEAQPSESDATGAGGDVNEVIEEMGNDDASEKQGAPSFTAAVYDNEDGPVSYVDEELILDRGAEPQPAESNATGGGDDMIEERGNDDASEKMGTPSFTAAVYDGEGGTVSYVDEELILDRDVGEQARSDAPLPEVPAHLVDEIAIEDDTRHEHDRI